MKIDISRNFGDSPYINIDKEHVISCVAPCVNDISYFHELQVIFTNFRVFIKMHGMNNAIEVMLKNH